ncbi:MAG: hypothetical protein IJV88_03080 [Ruminococcus sp.]|nr:hypothetical protein [Ruminococcus sp.]
MKKSSRTLALIMAILMVAGCTVLTCSASDETYKLSVYGDSIAACYGLEDPLTGYPTLITQDKPYTLNNEAISGDETSDMLRLLQTSDATRKNIAESELLVISIGGNDLLGPLQRATTAELFDLMMNKENSALIKNALASASTNLATITKEIRSLNADCTIIFQTIYNPIYANETYKNYATLIDSFAPIFNSMFYTLAESDDKIFVADVFTAFDNYYKETGKFDIIQADGIHPSQAGHSLIADVILELMAELEAAGVLPVVPAEKPRYLVGDSDGSEKITISDATAIQKSLAGLITFSSEKQQLAADSDRSGNINVKDATEIQKFLAGLLTETAVNTYVEY